MWGGATPDFIFEFVARRVLEVRNVAGRLIGASNLVVSDSEGNMTKRAAGGGGALSQSVRLEMKNFSRAAYLPEAGPLSAYTEPLGSFSCRFPCDSETACVSSVSRP